MSKDDKNIIKNIFLDKKIKTPNELIIEGWDLESLKEAKELGEVISHFTQTKATKCLINGNVKEANIYASKVTILQKNITNIENAIKILTNFKLN